MGVQVIATSSYLPTSVITNDDWAKRVDTSDEWILKRTGIKTRYWAKEQTMIAKQATSAEPAATGSGAWLNDQGTGI